MGAEAVVVDPPAQERGLGVDQPRRALAIDGPAFREAQGLVARSAKIRAISSWSRWRTLTRKCDTSSIDPCIVAVRLMQTSRLGGSTEIEDMAVAVMPIGVPPTQMVMTLTVEATRRIAWRNGFARRDRSRPSTSPTGASGAGKQGHLLAERHLIR